MRMTECAKRILRSSIRRGGLCSRHVAVWWWRGLPSDRRAGPSVFRRCCV